MSEIQKQRLDQVLASLMQGFIIPLVGIIAWAGMVWAYVVLDKPINIPLMSSALALAGVGKALDAFKVVKKQ